MNFAGIYHRDLIDVKSDYGYFDRFLIFTIILYLASEVFAGPIRTYLSSGFILFIYAPKILIAISIGLVIVRYISRARFGKFLLLVLILFFFCSLIGYVNTSSFSQVGVGVWAYFPLLLGIVIAPLISKKESIFTRLFWLLWIGAVIGVILSQNISFPWKGGEYSIGDYDVETSREWTTFGVDRPAGFSRASYAAAYQIAFLGLWLMIFCNRLFFKLSVFFISIYAIYVTTAKTAVLTFLVASILLLILSNFFKEKHSRILRNILMYFIVLIGLLLPLSTLFINYNFSFYDENSEFLLTSFGVRLSETWPNAFGLIFDNGNWFWGRGIGGMGMAQKVFEVNLYNPGDNFYLKLYSEFGLLFLPLLIWVIHRFSTIRVAGNPHLKMFFVVVFCYLTKGITSNGIEDGFSSLFVGAALATGFSTLAFVKKYN